MKVDTIVVTSLLLWLASYAANCGARRASHTLSAFRRGRRICEIRSCSEKIVSNQNDGALTERKNTCIHRWFHRRSLCRAIQSWPPWRLSSWDRELGDHLASRKSACLRTYYLSATMRNKSCWGSLVETSAINANNDPGVWEVQIRLLKCLDVLVSGKGLVNYTAK